MTNAQAKYLMILCGGLDEAIAAVGLPKQYSGRNAKVSKLEDSLSVGEASVLIDRLKKRPDPEIANLESELKKL